MRLHAENGVVRSKELTKNLQDAAKEEANKFRELAVKANWCETVFEAKPQLLLQIILLLETTASFTSIFGKFQFR